MAITERVFQVFDDRVFPFSESGPFSPVPTSAGSFFTQDRARNTIHYGCDVVNYCKSDALERTLCRRKIIFVRRHRLSQRNQFPFQNRQLTVMNLANGRGEIGRRSRNRKARILRPHVRASSYVHQIGSSVPQSVREARFNIRKSCGPEIRSRGELANYRLAAYSGHSDIQPT